MDQTGLKLSDPPASLSASVCHHSLHQSGVLKGGCRAREAGPLSPPAPGAQGAGEGGQGVRRDTLAWCPLCGLTPPRGWKITVPTAQDRASVCSLSQTADGALINQLALLLLERSDSLYPVPQYEARVHR